MKKIIIHTTFCLALGVLLQPMYLHGSGRMPTKKVDSDKSFKPTGRSVSAPVRSRPTQQARVPVSKEPVEQSAIENARAALINLVNALEGSSERENIAKAVFKTSFDNLAQLVR